MDINYEIRKEGNDNCLLQLSPYLDADFN